MKPAATFATFLALSMFVATDSAPNAPVLRSLRMNADIPAVKEDTDESRKDHHHHHVKKVKKIAIPVPVEVPQIIPVPVSIPSTVVASSDTAVVDSTTNVVSNNVAATDVVAPVALGTNVAPVPGAATPAPTSVNGRPAAASAATVTRPSRATPAPTRSFASVGPSRSQQPGAASAVPQSGDVGMAGAPSPPGFGNNNNALGAGLGAPGAAGGLLGNTVICSVELVLAWVASTGMVQVDSDSRWGSVHKVEMGLLGSEDRVQGGNFGQSGNNGFIGGQTGFGGAGTASGNAFGREGFNRRERQRRR
ncbi:unnamed protein product [Peronospora belbahrii]|uniref:Uncharacterized protein n=1 Tax=Peronospora belbahrii TaxID=622444 RepID=A0ABN8D6E0_9STRA|nr:unnamed protein product [Peronospora belbahrii]